MRLIHRVFVSCHREDGLRVRRRAAQVGVSEAVPLHLELEIV